MFLDFYDSGKKSKLFDTNNSVDNLSMALTMMFD